MAFRLERAVAVTVVMAKIMAGAAAFAEQPDSTQRTAQIQFVPGPEHQWVAALSKVRLAG